MSAKSKISKTWYAIYNIRLDKWAYQPDGDLAAIDYTDKLDDKVLIDSVVADLFCSRVSSYISDFCPQDYVIVLVEITPRRFLSDIYTPDFYSKTPFIFETFEPDSRVPRVLGVGVSDPRPY